MPAGSSPKRERQYEHIKESYEKRGQKGRAEEIAARTVNKERAEHGETQGAKAQARGSAGGQSGGERTKAELYDEAKRRGIEGRSGMNKEQLERALK
ncbi:plasmid stabilization protein [Ramlibacter sp. AW1]|uniref:Plasmid stabilization protein n=1 Tax=Ramlibacter aurantiacus TaxID=2801330 RepID=A0A937D0F0_9BURK|nr:plasmid stabilization protein [Ramlibacter aurantiacus]MBL0419359.1 plasmid stabilization protein [Ramlibacter aurantiacus]